MQSSELLHLLGKYINNTISEEEFKELWATLDKKQFDNEWHTAIGQVIENENLHGLSDPREMTGRLERIRELIEIPVQPVRKIRLIERPGIRYAAAAAVILALGCYWLFNTTLKQPAPIAAVQRHPDQVKPGTQKAILKLSDGTAITLDSMANGKIAQQGSTQVLKLANGQIRYQSTTADGTQTAVADNVMSTPMGGQYQLTLPDGTNVWLNAGSSITYPAAFPANERNVRITGEVYFEVAKDKNRTFRVTAGEQEIEVLGTHFNINAYADEEHVKTSLLEGAVKVNQVLLKPGQAYSHGKVAATDVDQDIAWKNGVFNFNNQSLALVMRQLARWYDLEIVYPQGIPQKEYGGEIGRNLTLDQVLKGLENSGLRFELYGRRLTVKS